MGTLILNHKKIYSAMKRTILKKWMMTLVITLFFYFTIEIQGMDDKNLNKKKIQNTNDVVIINEDWMQELNDAAEIGNEKHVKALIGLEENDKIIEFLMKK